MQSKTIILVAAVLCLLLLAPGCRTITQESATLISTGAAVGQGDLHDWADMTPEQRYTAHWKLTRAFYTLDFTVNSNPMPIHFVGEAGKNPPPGDTSWVRGVSP